MKKLLIMIAMAGFTSAAMAQETTLTSKNGTPILPEPKNWGIGFDASPFFDVIKGVFSSSDSSGADYARFTKNHPLTLYGKLVRDNNTMWRVSARINFGSDKTNYVTLLDSAGGSFTTPQYGNDVVKSSRAGVALGFGIEKRRGNGRLQGYYGPEVMIGYNTSKSKTTYANGFSEENQIPTISPAFQVQANNGRVVETNYGSQFDFRLRAFMGVEYFFMAKASLGLELGWGLSYTTTGEPDTQIEYWDPNLNSGSGGINKQRIPGDGNYVGKTSGFNADADNAYGALNLIFYF